jgi:ABC-type nickel/cobalt efflux system permease component RcnA
VLPIVVVLALGIGSTALTVAVLVGLVRSLRVLSRSVAKFRDDVQPLLEDVRKETEASQDVLQRISARQLGAGPGDRIRR